MRSSSRVAGLQLVVLLGCAGAAACAMAAEEEGDPVRHLPPIEIIHRTPVPGWDVPLHAYPANAQVLSDADIERAGALSFPDFLARRLPGVTSAEVQGNSFQPEINYRGQRLSGLLGAAQGLSAWLDGVRINQPLGDIISWDLLPEAAIADLALVPGSNPLYGRNTLAGALVLTTKSGLTHPGTEIEFSAGSHSRLRFDAGHGFRTSDGWHGYVSVARWLDGGWRRRSSGRVSNLFAKAGREQADGQGWTVSLLRAGSRLEGNGLLPESFGVADRSSYYTGFDWSRNEDSLVTAKLVADVARVRLSLGTWARAGRRDASTGDIDADAQPGEPNATLNGSRARQREEGLWMQAQASAGALRWTWGGEFARSRAHYDQSTQAAEFDASRAAQGLGSPVPGPSLDGRLRNGAAFMSLDTEFAGTRLDASLRADMSRTQNTIGAGAEAFRYRRVNSSLGVSREIGSGVVGFVSSTQGSRIPTSLELGCANPANPCVLPTGLQSDPYLKPVVTRTLEMGARAGTSALRMTASAFRSDSRDEIVFARSGVSQAGYFTNIDRTRRQGVELQLSGDAGPVAWRSSWVSVDATYRTATVLQGPLSTVDHPDVVKPGARLAGIPRHVVKAGADWRAGRGIVIGADAQAQSPQVVAGNESNSRPGLGKVPGFAVFNAQVRWNTGNGWQAFLRVSNLADRRYSTFAAGNRNVFAGGALGSVDTSPVERFLAPGSPRRFVLGVRYEWGPAS